MKSHFEWLNPSKNRPWNPYLEICWVNPLWEIRIFSRQIPAGKSWNAPPNPGASPRILPHRQIRRSVTGWAAGDFNHSRSMASVDSHGNSTCLVRLLGWTPLDLVDSQFLHQQVGNLHGFTTIFGIDYLTFGFSSAGNSSCQNGDWNRNSPRFRRNLLCWYITYNTSWPVKPH